MSSCKTSIFVSLWSTPLSAGGCFISNISRTVANTFMHLADLSTRAKHASDDICFFSRLELGSRAPEICGQFPTHQRLRAFDFKLSTRGSGVQMFRTPFSDLSTFYNRPFLRTDENRKGRRDVRGYLQRSNASIVHWYNNRRIAALKFWRRGRNHVDR